MPFDRDQGVRDPKFLRALAHPVRMKISDLLAAKGPMTATQLSELLGESPSNCSFHLRTMAKWGFIEEAEGGKGRERLWKHKSLGWGVDAEDLDAEGKAAHRELQHVQQQHRMWQENQWEARKGGFPEEWRRQAFSMDWEGPMSPAQVREVADGFGEVLKRVQESERTPDAVRVRIHIGTIPIGDPPGPQEKPKPKPKKAQKRAPKKKST